MHSTYDEHQEKQRLQWRRNQQKCRERKRQKIRNYQDYLLRIREGIFYLEKLKASALYALHASEHLSINAIQNSYRLYLIQTYYTLFQHGTLSTSAQCPSCQSTEEALQSYKDIAHQLQMKRTIFIDHFLHPNIVTAHVRGMEYFWDQWEGSSLLFENFHLELVSSHVLYSFFTEYGDINSDCLLRTTWQLTATITLRTLQTLFPSLSTDYYPSLLGKTLELDGSSNYMFQGMKVIRIDGERQIIPCMLKILNGNLKLTLTLLQNEEIMKTNGWLNRKLLRRLVRREDGVNK